MPCVLNCVELLKPRFLCHSRWRTPRGIAAGQTHLNFKLVWPSQVGTSRCDVSARIPSGGTITFGHPVAPLVRGADGAARRLYLRNFLSDFGPQRGYVGNDVSERSG